MARKRSASPEEEFWAWFAENSADLLAVRTAREPVIAGLHDHLEAVQDGLCFEFGPFVEGRREFIVSGDGSKERFGAVKRLVALAPNLPTWLVIAFRPPKPTEGQILRYGDVELSTDDVWFTSEGGLGGKIDLELYVRGLDEDEPEPMAAPAFILLDATLGEFVVETRIGGIGWHALPDDPEAEWLRPFSELGSAVALPIRFPVSLLDTLGGPADLPPEVPRDPARADERWSMAEVRRGSQVSFLGLRDGLPDRTPELDHEILIRVTFDDPSENGLPGAEELAAARRYAAWITAALRARGPVEEAVTVTGDGVRDVYLYCSDPAVAVEVWEQELQPVIRSHQVAFYVRRSHDREVYRNLRRQFDAGRG